MKNNKTKMTEVEKEPHKCDFCGKKTNSKYVWGLRLSYGGKGDFYSKHICKKCITNKLDMKRDTLNFIEGVTEFKIERNMGIWTDWKWEEITALVKELKKRNIDVYKNYNVSLGIRCLPNISLRHTTFYGRRDDVFLHKELIPPRIKTFNGVLYQRIDDTCTICRKHKATMVKDDVKLCEICYDEYLRKYE